MAGGDGDDAAEVCGVGCLRDARRGAIGVVEDGAERLVGVAGECVGEGFKGIRGGSGAEKSGADALAGGVRLCGGEGTGGGKAENQAGGEMETAESAGAMLGMEGCS